MVIGYGYQASGAAHAGRSKLIGFARFCGFWAMVGFLAASIL